MLKTTTEHDSSSHGAIFGVNDDKHLCKSLLYWDLHYRSHVRPYQKAIKKMEPTPEYIAF